MYQESKEKLQNKKQTAFKDKYNLNEQKLE